MKVRNHIVSLSPITWIILLAAAVKFALHMFIAPGYGYFFDELYTMALSRTLLGESLVAMHIVPALAGSAALVFTK